MNKILRVFPYRTSYTPDDDMTWIGSPGFAAWLPEFDEVHISCTFTWDMEACEALQDQWQGITEKPVKLGGPAYTSPCNEHIPGRYTKPGVLFTSRGCNHNCPWCLVPNREGALRELEVRQGNIIQDNNFLQCSQAHQEKVFSMLRGQKQIQFRGGLESRLLTDRFVEAVRGLRIDQLWLACDTKAALPIFKMACQKLKNVGFSREKIRCYVLIGDDMNENEARLREVYHAGAMPFAQLHQPAERKKQEYSLAWKAFARQWQRPAATKAHMERGTSYEDYGT